MRRLVPLTCLLLLTAGCGLKKMMPEGPALDPEERARQFPGDTSSGVTYTGAPEVSFPVLPVVVFGATYDVDLVIVSRHPTWNMHEYARITTPNGPLWVAKDARESTMSQSLVADVPDLAAWMPEIPLPRKSSPVQVVDASTEDWLDLAIDYENIDGEPVSVRYEGKPPRTLQTKRNGSTFGHSRDHVLVALDLSHRDFARRAEVTIGGAPQKLKRLLGIVPFAMVLQQTQGGIAVTDLTLTTGDPLDHEPHGRDLLGSVPLEAQDAGERAGGTRRPGFTGTFLAADDTPVVTAWSVTEADGWVEAVQRADLRTLHYRFRAEGGALELSFAEVRQWGQPEVTTRFEVHPALPDLRRPFDGRYTGRFVLDVNGQQGHAVGTVEAWWDAEGAHLEVRPTAPWFVADRPMRTTLTFAEEEAHVRTVRIP